MPQERAKTRRSICDPPEDEDAVLVEDELPARAPAHALEPPLCELRSHEAVGEARMLLVIGDPGCPAEHGEAENARPRRQVGAQRVRGADDGPARNQAEGLRRHPVVVGDGEAVRQQGLTSGDVAPEGKRAQPIVADQRREQDDGGERDREPCPPSREARRAEDRRHEQRRDLACGVVVVDRRL